MKRGQWRVGQGRRVGKQWVGEVLLVLESWGGVWAWNEANGTGKAGGCLAVEGCMGGRADAEDEGRRDSLSRDRIRTEGRLPFGCGGATRKGLDSTPSSACPSPGQRGALASVLLAWEEEAEKERMCSRGRRRGRVGGWVGVAALAAVAGRWLEGRGLEVLAGGAGARLGPCSAAAGAAACLE